jgi:hypothetical protein
MWLQREYFFILFCCHVIIVILVCKIILANFADCRLHTLWIIESSNWDIIIIFLKRKQNFEILRRPRLHSCIYIIILHYVLCMASILVHAFECNATLHRPWLYSWLYSCTNCAFSVELNTFMRYAMRQRLAILMCLSNR